MQKVRLSVIIVNRNSGSLLYNYLLSLINYSCTSLVEYIVVDNASTDNSLDLISQLVSSYNIKVIKLNTNKGYVNAVNIGFEYARGDLIVVSNEDLIMLTKCWDTKILNLFDRFQKIGICAPIKLRLEDFSRYDGVGTCLNKFLLGYDKFFNSRRLKSIEGGRPIELIPYPPGAFYAIRREIALTPKTLLNPLLFMYYDDVEIGIRAYLNGFLVGLCKNLFVAHKRGTVGIKDLPYFLSRRNHYIVARLYYPVAIPFWFIYTIATAVFLSIYSRSHKYVYLFVLVLLSILKMEKMINKLKKYLKLRNNTFYISNCDPKEYLQQFFRKNV